MHVRFSTLLGMAVVDREDEVLGSVCGIILQPDRGMVDGFFIRQGGMSFSGDACVAVRDITRVGLRMEVRDAHCVGPLAEHIRLQETLSDGRRILGQRIMTEGGAILGCCGDVQFNTVTFAMEWLFPRRFWWWRRPLPARCIIEVRRDAIVVRDEEMTVGTKQGREAAPNEKAGGLVPA